MALFHYQAVTVEGEPREGTIEGADEQRVVQQLQARGLIPVTIELGGAERGLSNLLETRLGGRGVGQGVVLIFTQQLAALMQAGIALDRALGIMLQVSDDEHLKALAEQVQEGVRRGQPLSRVLAEQPANFSGFYISMVQAAEGTGDLATGLDQLAGYLTRSKQLREQVLSALIYPIILVVVAAFSLIIILTYVVPQFQQLFDDMGQGLPLSTAIVIATAELLRDYLHWLLLGLLLILLGFRYLQRRPGYRLWWHRNSLKLPLSGTISRRLETARFCRSLGTLLQGGVPMLTALGIARETLGNSWMARAVEEASLSVKEGGHLAPPLQAGALFPSLALQMIQVGEESGQLEAMLLRVADLYDREVATAIQRALTILTPLLIVGLGVVIAGIIMSILVAIMSINDIPI